MSHVVVPSSHGGPAVEVNINQGGDARIRLYHSYPPPSSAPDGTNGNHPPEPVPSNTNRQQPVVSQSIAAPVTSAQIMPRVSITNSTTDAAAVPPHMVCLFVIFLNNDFINIIIPVS
jgi:hypothetical protein